jgi:mannose-6-phosphate isomerase-like protein (cupin superfamily)
MNARLSAADLQPVANLLERVLNVRQAMSDLHDANQTGVEFCVAVTQREHGKDVAVAHTHDQSYWVVLQGLAAMERELLLQLQNKEISVESALPMREGT